MLCAVHTLKYESYNVSTGFDYTINVPGGIVPTCTYAIAYTYRLVAIPNKGRWFVNKNITILGAQNCYFITGP